MATAEVASVTTALPQDKIEESNKAQESPTKEEVTPATEDSKEVESTGTDVSESPLAAEIETEAVSEAAEAEVITTLQEPTYDKKEEEIPKVEPEPVSEDTKEATDSTEAPAPEPEAKVPEVVVTEPETPRNEEEAKNEEKKTVGGEEKVKTEAAAESTPADEKSAE